MEDEFTFKAFLCRRCIYFFLILFIISASASAQTSWKGTISTAWSTAGNWTNGAPTSSVDAIIGDGNFTGPNQPTVSSTATCKSLTLGGTVTSALTVSSNLTVAGNVLINSNGTLKEGRATITYKGNFTNNGSLTVSAQTKEVFAGSNQIIAGTASTAFKSLTINVGSVVTFNTNFSTGNRLTINGTLIPAEFATPKYTGNITVASGGVLKVNAATYLTNYSASPTLNAGSTVEYSSITTNQTVSNSFTYSTLRVSGTGVKTLAGSLTALTSSTASNGNIYVTAGTLDLSSFTANRGTTTVGGTLSISNGATLKIGGTNSFPINYSTVSVGVTSTVEYSGTNQTVISHSYGNLMFSSSTGNAVKTLPATALTVSGNFSSMAGVGTGLNFTAASNITVIGDVNIGASTIFDGGSFSHNIGGNWTNNGTFTGSTSTVIMTSPAKSISGTGVQNFNNLTLAASNITALGSGNLTVAGNLATTGAGTFTQSPGGTLIMSGTSKTITGTGFTFDNFTASGSITATSNIVISGNLAVSGSFTNTGGIINMTGSSKTISGVGTISPGTLTIDGSVTTASNFSINGTLDVNGTFSASAGTATFTASSTIDGTANLFNVNINGTSLQLATSAVLGIANAFTITSGALNTTTTTPNTVNYNGTGAQTVTATTYNNLILSNGNTKTAGAGLTINRDLTIAATTTFNASLFTHSIAGNFSNSGTFTASTGTISFNGTSDGTISGATTFNILTVNKTSATGNVSLLNNISAATINMSNGNMNTGSNTITITVTRTGNGYIYGNIQRTHAFTTGLAYAFEGPNNTITFSSVSGVSSITVNVTKGIVSTFPYEGAINRQYNITIPSGTYNATLRLHYETEELNGNGAGTMKLWRYDGTAWTTAGQTGSSSTANYMELSGLTSINTKWTLSDDVNVVTWNGSVSSDWSNAANWTSTQGSPSLPPGNNDIVAIGTADFTNQPVISTLANAESVLFGSVKPATLTLTTGGSLISGNITGSWNSNAAHTINVNDQTLTVNGELQLSKGTTSQVISLNIGSGTVNISQDVIQSGGANITFTGTGSLNIGDDFDYSSGTFNAGTGTVIFNGTQEQITAGVAYNNLVINKSAGIAFLNTAATIAGNLTISAGELDINAPTVVTGNVTIASGAILNGDGVTTSVAGNWNNSGTFISSSGTINLNGTSAQTVSATTFNNFTINKTSGTATLSANCFVNGNVTITAGTLDLSTFSLNRSSAGGTLSVSDGANLVVGGAHFPSNFLTSTLSSNSNVTYNGGNAQSIAGITYGNLTLTNGGVNVKTLTANAAVNGNITINSGVTFSGSSYSISLSGNWVNNGAYTPGTSTVIANGTGKTFSGTTTFYKLSVFGSYTVNASNLTFNGLLQTVSGGSFNSGTGTLLLNADFTNNGSFTHNGVMTFSGTAAQAIRFNGFSAASNSAVNFNGTVAPSFNSTSGSTFGNLNINNTASTGISPSLGWTVSTIFNIAAGATFNGGAATHTIGGSFTNNGTVTSSGTLNFNPAAAQTIQLTGASFSSTGSVIFGGSGALTVSGTPTTLTDVVIANTTGVTPSSNWTIGRDFTINTDAIFNAGSYSFSMGGNINTPGTLNGGTSTFTMTSSSGSVSGSPATTFYDFVVSGTIIVNAAFNINRNFTNNGIIDATAAEPVFTGSAAATITGSAASFDLAEFAIQKNAGSTVTLTKNITAVTDVAIISGTLDLGASTIAQDATPGAVNNLTISAGALLKIGGSNSLPTFTNYYLDTLSTVEYAGNTQSIAAVPYGNLTISSAGTKTPAAAIAILNNFSLSNGIFSGGSYTHTVGGNWNMTSGTFTNTGTTITLNGTNTQNIFSTGAFNNLTINKTAANATLTSDISVNGTLNFTLGSVATAANKLIIPSGGTVTGAGQTTGWVNGKLQKYFSTTAGGAFEVGGPLYYSPVSASFASVTTAGSLIASANASYHPNITASGIQQNRSIKRYWTISKPSSGSIAYTTATLSFTWNSADNYSPITASLEKVALYNGSTWSLPTLTGTPTTTNIQVTGVSSTGDFAVGETCNLATGFSYASSPYCSNAGTANITLNGGATAGSFSASSSGLTLNPSTGAVTLSSSTPRTYTVTNSATGTGGCVSSSTATITITTAPYATISYAGSPYCSNAGTASVTFTGTTGGTYSSAAGLSINTTTGAVNLGASTPGTYTVTYTVAASSGCAAYSTTADMTVVAAGTWTGVVNNDWNNAGNWSCSLVPTSLTDVTIQDNASAFPVINSGTIAIRNLTIPGGASLTVSNAILQISGTVANSGTFSASIGTVEMNGTVTQTIAANTFAANTIKDLIITNPAGVSLAGTLNITNALSFGNINNSTFSTGGFLTLISNAAGTARVADISNAGTNTGNTINGLVTTERFITAKRAFRFLTPAVNTPGSIRANWMENTNNSSASINNNPVPNYGTHISGSGGNLNGFDETRTNNPSLYTFNNVTQAWVPATNTNIQLITGTAYRIMVRGSRSTDLSNNNATPSLTTLRAAGTLITGAVLMRKPGGGGSANMPELSAATNGYSFIGNPYASPVNWTALEKTDLSSTVYIFDPTIAGANGRGGYVSYNSSTGTSNISSQVDNNIQAGQAFFVQTTGPNPSLTFREQYKSGTNKAVFRDPKQKPHLSLQLLLPGQENTGGSADGLAAYFSNDFDSSIGNEDSYKFTNQDENIAIVRNGKTLSIEGRKPVVSKDTLPLKIWQLMQKDYTIRIVLAELHPGLESFLEDSYLHTSTKLNSNAETFIRFSLTGDSASFAPDRFRVVFQSFVTLPAQLSDIRAYEKNKGVEVVWSAKSESNLNRYEVEKSKNAQQFELIGTVKAKATLTASFTYSFFDATPWGSKNYYRVKCIDKSGEVKYSEVVNVAINSNTGSINVFPNPVTGNVINLVFKEMKKGKYTASLINNSGQKVYEGNILHEGGSGSQPIKLNHSLPKGIYQLEMSADLKLKSILVFVQ